MGPKDTQSPARRQAKPGCVMHPVAAIAATGLAMDQNANQAFRNTVSLSDALRPAPS